jgi:hypothetical protein
MFGSDIHTDLLDKLISYLSPFLASDFGAAEAGFDMYAVTEGVEETGGKGRKNLGIRKIERRVRAPFPVWALSLKTLDWEPLLELAVLAENRELLLVSLGVTPVASGVNTYL